VFRWIHHRGVTDFAMLTDVAKETRAKWKAIEKSVHSHPKRES
jgi:adenine C2-methylase RlmN of 23S rRNA A2503 and tRNA A37